jgi:flagellar biosynthesis/type III secretory pathway M-ring protein FliF/YscJ
MAVSGGNQKGLLAVVLILIVALVVVFVLWQRDQESTDLRIDFDTGDAGTVVEPGPSLAGVLPEGIGLSMA